MDKWGDQFLEKWFKYAILPTLIFFFNFWGGHGPLSHQRSSALRYKLKKLVTSYFLHEGILFKKGYDEDPLQCLRSEKAKEILKEVHFGECGEHQGRKNLYRCSS